MTPQQPSPYRCIVSWCDFHCEIRSNHVCNKPPTCGCLYNPDIGAIWEPVGNSAIQQPGQQEEQCPYWIIARVAGVDGDTNEWCCSRPVHEQQASLKDIGFNEGEAYWYTEGIKTLKTIRDLISTHRDNNTILTRDGITALWMQLNFVIKCFPQKVANEQQFPIPTDKQCRICEQAIRKDATGKVLDYLEDYMRQEEINDERTPYESFVWILHQVIPSLRKGEQE
jgi:hypothetical protein